MTKLELSDHEKYYCLALCGVLQKEIFIRCTVKCCCLLRSKQEEKKQQEADALFAYSLKSNPTAKKKIKQSQKLPILCTRQFHVNNKRLVTPRKFRWQDIKKIDHRLECKFCAQNHDYTIQGLFLKNLVSKLKKNRTSDLSRRTLFESFDMVPIF